jgi:hypothetical protein
VTVLEFEPIEGEVPPEVQPKEVPEDAERTTESTECPDYQPASFIKCKPQSIISFLCFKNAILSLFMFNALSIGVG